MALTASARIKLLAAVANHLAAEEWTIIDLTLSQFGLPTTDTWSGTRMSFLEELTVWKPSFAKRINEAAENNGQILSAWGVPERVTALLKKKGEQVDKSDDEIPF